MILSQGLLRAEVSFVHAPMIEMPRFSVVILDPSSNISSITSQLKQKAGKIHSEILMDVTSLDGHPNLRTNINIMNLKQILLTFELSFLVLKFMRLQTDVRKFLPSKGVTSKRFQDVTITFNGKCVIKRYSLMMHYYHMLSISIFG